MNLINCSTVFKRPRINFTSITAGLLSAVLVTQLTACGTIFHPERKGLSGGRLDPAIVALDGLGLILFLIPGLVAFGIDFYHGTIYLPGTKTTQLTDEELNQIRQHGSVDLQSLETILSNKLNQDLSLDDKEIGLMNKDVELIKFNSTNGLATAVNFSNQSPKLAHSNF